MALRLSNLHLLFSGQDFEAGPALSTRKKWPDESDLQSAAKNLGFLNKPALPQVLTFFAAKGGCLKTTLSLNFARIAALHGIRTCVVGIDMQCDLSRTLSLSEGESDELNLEELLKKSDQTRGLRYLFSNPEQSVDEVLTESDLPNLFFIPETPDLVVLDQELGLKNRREYWLEDHVISHLKKNFDLILIDAPPGWSHLVTNALVSSDALISPLECRINHFRNHRVFRALIHAFKKDFSSQLQEIYVPTRLSPQRKLSRDIWNWYQSQVLELTAGALSESRVGEEASALQLSWPEHRPGSDSGREMNSLIKEISSQLGWLPKAQHQPQVKSVEKSTLATH